MTDLMHFALAFVAGVLVKAVDWMDDDRKTSAAYKIPVAIIYGILIGYLISLSSFSTIFLSALVAQVFARKIDTIAHRIGFLVAAASLIFFGFPPLDIGVFLFFLILAFLDEMDFIGFLRSLTEYRLFLKLGALLFFAFGRLDYFVAIMLFDVGYETFNRLTKHKKQKQQKGING